MREFQCKLNQVLQVIESLTTGTIELFKLASFQTVAVTVQIHLLISTYFRHPSFTTSFPL